MYITEDLYIIACRSGEPKYATNDLKTCGCVKWSSCKYTYSIKLADQQAVANKYMT